MSRKAVLVRNNPAAFPEFPKSSPAAIIEWRRALLKGNENVEVFYAGALTAIVTVIVIILWDTWRDKPRLEIDEFSMKKPNDFSIIVRNKGQKPVSRCHGDLLIRGMESGHSCKAQLYWEIPEIIRATTTSSVKPKISATLESKEHYLLYGDVPRWTRKFLKEEDFPPISLPSHPDLYELELTIYDGGMRSVHVLWYFIPENYQDGMVIPCGYIGRLRHCFPRKLRVRLIERRIKKAAGAYC